jgi:hypothetical protein
MNDAIYFDARLVNVRAHGSAHIPVLDVQVEVKAQSWGGGESVRVQYEKGDDVQLTPFLVDPYLTWNPDPNGAGESWSQFVARGFPKSTRVNPLSVDGEPAAQYELLFPIAPATLSQMEETRADKPRFGVVLRFSGIVQRKVPSATAPPIPEPFQITVPVWRADARGQPPEIERSKWVDEILPGLGAGAWIVYEIPTVAFEGSAQVDEYLRNAVTQFNHHEWKLCVAACRDVVEALEPELAAEVNTAFGGRGGSAPRKTRALMEGYANLIEAIQTFQASSKSFLAAGAHPERPEQLIERPDAEFALWIALAMRRYVGMRLKSNRPPAFVPPGGRETGETAG